MHDAIGIYGEMRLWTFLDPYWLPYHSPNLNNGWLSALAN